MKHFFRTVAGKTLCFITCLVSLCVLIASVTGAVCLIEWDFYTQSEAALCEDVLKNQFTSEGVGVIYAAEYSATKPLVLKDEGAQCMLTGKDGKVLAISREALLSGQRDFTHTLHFGYVRFAEENAIDVFTVDGYEVYSDPETIYVDYHFDLTPGTQEAELYSFAARLVHLAYALRYWIYLIALVSLLLSIVSFIVLMCVSGKRPHTEEIIPGVLNRVPFDLLLAAVVLLGMFVILLADSFSYIDVLVATILLAGIAAFACIGLGLCMSFAARVKQRSLLKNTVIYRCIRLCGKCLKGIWRLLSVIPLVWRTALIVLGYMFLEFLVMMLCWWESDVLLVFWFMTRPVVFAAVLYVALMLRKLQKGGEALASGNLRHYTDTKGLFWDFKRHGENLNSIAVGMNAAVEERLKSERMKTELITNVSHDIKTPLTSIINYADLIGKEPCENKKITEYAGVLTRQSARLRRLIDDLVEASKASTGNLEVNLAPCDASVFLMQAAGEYEQRLADAGLTLVTKQPEETVRIMADGRRMWRIFDNLMTNICKYALPGTRVYLNLEPMGDQVVISFKNTSRQQLDIREEELLERFVRGDTSRSTEGNGLGLSIARSLAELQKGELRVFIDGDLFKVILIFPKL